MSGEEVWRNEDAVRECSSQAIITQYRQQQAKMSAPSRLASIQGQLRRLGGGGGKVSRCPLHLQRIGTLSHLEMQMKAALALGSSSDYRALLFSLVKFYIQEGTLISGALGDTNLDEKSKDWGLILWYKPVEGLGYMPSTWEDLGFEARIREICDELLGPAHTSTSSSHHQWESCILGMSKRSLLKEVLGMVTSNIALQRLFLEYTEQLESINGGSSSPKSS
ncbi:unnamed protein product [Darwinula stevensoni]|uniref:Protein HIRA-like C-terminal domain-containing protein n=1 Tax=Darwinula stevensoni TaxID=69355 RepID=A0A7R9ADX6_9CRUS|nr:unnamed protein product [Darwinula stevensoni]CAG0901741.1 unnamed protein product [Darwinula stevensoni]